MKPDSASDDSSSSSSSDSDKKNKKSKKNKKKAKKAKKDAKKAAKKAKEEKARKLMEEKEKKARAAASKKVKAKIDVNLQCLVDAMAQPGIGRIPDCAKEQATAMMLTLQRTTDQASRAEKTLKVDMPDLKEATKVGGEAKKLVGVLNKLVQDLQSLTGAE